MEKTDSEKPESESLSSPTMGEPPTMGLGLGSAEQSSSSCSTSAASNNPLYCSYVDGKFTYKDPTTNAQYIWNETEKKWVVKEEIEDPTGGVIIDSNKLADSNDNNDNDNNANANANAAGGGGGDEIGGGRRNVEMISPGTSQVQFDGESYTYTDQDGTVFLWDAAKGAWFPKDPPSANDSSSTSASSQFPLLPPSPPDLSQSTNASTQSIGFFNPNYSTQLTSPTTTDTGGDGIGAGETGSSTSASTARRFYYAALSPESMGVNENPGLFLSPDDQVNNNDQPQSLLQQPPQPEQAEQSQGQTQQQQEGEKSGGDGGTGEKVINEDSLPPGWEKHEDGNGPYYWHVKSGTIQRERPTLNSPVSSIVSQMSSNPALMIPGGMMSGFVRRSNTVVGGFGAGSGGSGSGSNNSNSEKRKSWVNYLEDTNTNHHHTKSDLMGWENKGQNQQQQQREPLQQQQPVTSLPAYEFDKNALKFAAVSLGCLSISEEDLTPERSSRAVSKVIAELTSGSGGGGGKEGRPEVPTRIWTHTDAITLQQQMYLELTDSHLRVKVHKMADPINQQHQSQQITVLEQPIHSIRVWGVGREDPRDFAFVAREKLTRQFLCHVFRLEMYARPLASSLRDACKKIMIERQARIGGSGGNNNGGGGKRPTSLGLKKNHNNHHHHGHSNNHDGRSNTGSGSNVGGTSGVSGLLFPTPMDEPRKMIKAYYLGSKSVCKPTGMDVLNGAIDSLMKTYGVEKIPVLVSVAPSVIGITSTTESPPKVQIEVRVRFLSFMGIGTDVRTCGIIIHTSRDDFEAHCFYSTPSTGALCKAIEAACVLRYQKCLDAHHPGGETGGNNAGGGRTTRSNSTAGQTDPNSSNTSSSTVTSPKSAAMIAASASNLASAFKTVLSSFGKGKSVDEGK